ncbi:MULTISPECIES: histidine phosphatase family protein [unclassified Aureimonas]|uniref:histidine phosphatase family protein n=1 Tax=unclassified Aureimonas TaxID=2615206 RepID=UPI0006FA3C0D|nr:MULTISPECIES: histidine phosphatase family protein [unclassified Aureimonas]KQT64246.1 hypothetical protein ASG62_04435 [Aureimonas sp. Leaf427]KQT81435.1 hypothetical protein ASG54_01700 [Aureimonas sp. Leaf460]
MIDLLLLRHAPTLWNAEKRIQGRADVPLSPAGRALAAGWRLPDEMAGWPVVASPLARAIETAKAMGLAPHPFPPLIEMDWGALEGRHLADIRSDGGAVFARNEAAGLDFRPEGGETPRDVGERAIAGLAGLSGAHVGVTHKGVLRALFARALGWDMRGKAPVRIADGACHHFRLSPAGGLALVEANIVLARPDQPSQTGMP